MTTVGYGDVFPKSYGGRIMGTFICLWGVLLVSLFVVTISEALEFSQPQNNAYTLLQRLLFKHRSFSFPNLRNALKRSRCRKKLLRSRQRFLSDDAAGFVDGAQVFDACIRDGIADHFIAFGFHLFHIDPD